MRCEVTLSVNEQEYLLLELLWFRLFVHIRVTVYERLIFQNLTYNMENPCCNEHPIPVLLMMTSNAPDINYLNMMQNYQQTMSSFVGPTEIFISGDTLQLKDYSKTDWPWTLFDPEAKQKRHDEIFPQECRKAFEMGAALALK